MSKNIWKKVERLKAFDSAKRGFLGYCCICEENVDKGKEIVIEKDGLRKWIRAHPGVCMNKLMKLLDE